MILKKIKIVSYIVLFTMIAGCGFFIYKTVAKSHTENEANEKDKSFAELEFFEHELVDLLNNMNNIKFENYTISATNKNTKKDSKSSDSLNDNSGGSQKKESSNGDESKSSSENQNTKNDDSQNSGSDKSTKKDSSTLSNNQQYKLDKNGVLTRNTEIDWVQIKNKVETNYTLMSSLSTDLCKTGISQNDINNFANQYDNLTDSVKNQNKESTLMALSNLYEFMPKFASNCSNDEIKIIVFNTKNNLFKAYSILDSEKWDEISNYVNKTSSEFYKIFEINNKDYNNYNINKICVMLTDLKNSTKNKDADTFLIKYKNTLESLENIKKSTN